MFEVTVFAATSLGTNADAHAARSPRTPACRDRRDLWQRGHLRAPADGLLCARNLAPADGIPAPANGTLVRSKFGARRQKIVCVVGMAKFEGLQPVPFQ